MPLTPSLPMPGFSEEDDCLNEDQEESVEELNQVTEEAMEEFSLAPYTEHTPERETTSPGEANPSRPRPGWTYELRPELADKDMLATISTSNILQGKRRAALAIAMDLDVPPDKVEHWRAMRAAMINEENNPRTYREALRSPKANSWKKAVKKELNSMTSKCVWSVVEKPMETHILTSTWVFKTKRGAQGEWIKDKAWLCIWGFLQIPSVDFDDMFALTGTLETLWTILSIAANEDLELHQMDVNTAFLNATIEKTIYMSIPDGMDGVGMSTKC